MENIAHETGASTLAGMVSQAHFRVPETFMKQVRDAARQRGISASGFMRMAVLTALQERHQGTN